MRALILASKHILTIALIVGSFVLVLPPATASAQASAGNGGCDAYFLTMPAWYNGVNRMVDMDDEGNASCEIAPPSAFGLGGFVWRIALNLVEILLNLVGYASVGFIIYGGYKYMISAGSPDGMVSARKTIMNAVIGLAISIASVGIVQTIAGSLGGGA
jgi:hypothetical protein